MNTSTNASGRQVKAHSLPHGFIYEASAQDVYPLLKPGSYEMAWVDGPYGLNKAGWDRFKTEDLPEWYEPHIKAWGALLAPSASIYHWGTAASWAAVHPVYLRMGWTFRALITWDKGLSFLAGKCDVEGCRTWPDVTEVCGFYQREELSETGGAAQYIAYAAGASEGNTIRKWLQAERERVGLPLSELKVLMNEAGGAGEMIVRHSFYESQWCMPTWDQWRLLHQVLNAQAGGPYLQRDLSKLYEHEALRAEYEALRTPFRLPAGITNVWRENQVQGAARLKESGGALHPCQKPNIFTNRAIMASTRPGGAILEPFGGTCRVAVSCEQIARYKPQESRKYTCIELNQDGVDYVRPVIKQIEEEGRQVSLFEARSL